VTQPATVPNTAVMMEGSTNLSRMTMQLLWNSNQSTQAMMRMPKRALHLQAQQVRLPQILHALALAQLDQIIPHSDSRSQTLTSSARLPPRRDEMNLCDNLQLFSCMGQQTNSLHLHAVCFFKCFRNQGSIGAFVSYVHFVLLFFFFCAVASLSALSPSRLAKRRARARTYIRYYFIAYFLFSILFFFCITCDVLFSFTLLHFALARTTACCRMAYMYRIVCFISF
jgi:hypothetical protein